MAINQEDHVVTVLCIHQMLQDTPALQSECICIDPKIKKKKI